MDSEFADDEDNEVNEFADVASDEVGAADTAE